MATYNHQQQEQAPSLLPLKKKAGQSNPMQSPHEKKSVKNDAFNNLIKDSIQKQPQNTQSKEDEKNNALLKRHHPTSDRMQQGQKKNRMKKDNQFNKMQIQRTKENEKMKSLIGQMLTSMSTKDLTQQLYPVSNEVIQQFIMKIQQEIQKLQAQMQKKQGPNQNDFHVKKQLETIKKQISHCSLIRELYCEKINYKNKIQTLEQEIINLKSQNRDLKLKVCRGIQNIQNYKHNLPCDRQKQLKQKLSICTQQLSRQREMRQNLQKNIQSIIMNFKKLYEEADAARQIVTRKLKQVQERERKLRKLKEEEDFLQEQNRKKYNNYNEYSGQKKPQQNSFYDVSNDYNYNNQADSRKNGEQDIKKSPIRTKNVTNAKQKQKQQKKLNQSVFASMTLEQKIKKMRSNQNNFKKILNN